MSLIGAPLTAPAWKPETKQNLLKDLEIAEAAFKVADNLKLIENGTYHRAVLYFKGVLTEKELEIRGCYYKICCSYEIPF